MSVWRFCDEFYLVCLWSPTPWKTSKYIWYVQSMAWYIYFFHPTSCCWYISSAVTAADLRIRGCQLLGEKPVVKWYTPLCGRSCRCQSFSSGAPKILAVVCTAASLRLIPSTLRFFDVAMDKPRAKWSLLWERCWRSLIKRLAAFLIDTAFARHLPFLPLILNAGRRERDKTFSEVVYS